MCIRYLGFLLLICLPGKLHGQSAPQSCTAPNLDGGFFAPKLETYPHGAQLTYTCNSGRVPVVRGWWVTSSCQNGKWSHEPQCIESLHACSAPPKIPHAIIIDQEYQDLFAADSVLQYECEDGFTVEGVDTKKIITCISGNWTPASPCRSTGSGSTVGVTNGGHTTSTQPTGRGSSTTSGSNDRNSQPSFISIGNCGEHPVIPNSVVVETGDKYLKYKCVAYHKLVGSQTVRCYSGGTWSQKPVCEESFCVINPVQLAGYNIRIDISGSEYMEEGEKYYNCIWPDYSILFECTNRQLSVTQCCRRYDHNRGRCREKIPLRSG